jgi:tRNA-dihydrouridine synthase A
MSATNPVLPIGSSTRETAAVRGRAWPLSVAPMMDRTDRHYRWFVRGITRHTLLYTEMVTTGAVLHGRRDALLDFAPDEHPLALQLGGDDPASLTRCGEIAQSWGYDEVNLNVGCPSDRVQRGRFGACLMLEPQRVARCVEALRGATTLPITVKHRIGVDEQDGFRDLLRFVGVVAAAGADRFIVHARKAWLSGLSPKQNRTVPPLLHDRVWRLKRERPDLRIEINGGIASIAEATDHLEKVDGVMIGRAAYERPYCLAAADGALFGVPRPVPSRREIVDRMLGYVEEQRRHDVHLGKMTRHMLGLFAERPGARRWRRVLSEEAYAPGAGPEVIERALERIPTDVLDARE